MTLITKTKITDAKDKQDQYAKIRDVQINLKSYTAPTYFPKIESGVELDCILTDNKLYGTIDGFVFEIQDYGDITAKVNSLKNQKTLNPNVEGYYQKFKNKIIIIDTMPEILYYTCKEREKYLKIYGLSEYIKKIINRKKSNEYITLWRELHNKRMGLKVQKGIMSRLSVMGSDQLMPLIPFIKEPSGTLLKIAMEMNLDLQKAISYSMKEYDGEPCFYFAMDYRVFSDDKFKNSLLHAIDFLAENQNKMEDSKDIFRKSTTTFIKILGFNSKKTECRENFKDFLQNISALRDIYGLSIVFLDTVNLSGQLTVSCGADGFSDRVTCRQKLKPSESSGFGYGGIYLAGEKYECAIKYGEYCKKFQKNNNLTLCSHDYCKTNLKKDIQEKNHLNYNRESRRIHNLLCKLDHIHEVKKHIEERDIRSIVFKIGESNDIGMNYINPYYTKKIESIIKK